MTIKATIIDNSKIIFVWVGRATRRWQPKQNKLRQEARGDFNNNINNIIQQHCARNNTARAQGKQRYIAGGEGRWEMGDKITARG